MTKHTPLWDFVSVTGFCWNWTGPTVGPYGKRSGKLAHRVVFELLVGDIPEGLELDHLCRNTLCVNPDHLEPVTRAENMRRRSVLYGACKNRHPFTPENTYRRPSGHRMCRACNRASTAAYLTRKAAA